MPVKLMNSAMMPQAGTYRMSMLTESEFAERLHAAPFQSFIGYEATATHIQQIAGVHVPVSRAETTLAAGDTLLVCRLNFRMVDPKRKADRNYVPQRSDYEYCAVEYSA